MDQASGGRAGGVTAGPAAYTSGHVEACGVRLHFLDYGAAGKPPMLCVHGGAAHAHWFDFVAAGFTADFHVRSLDLRGHGDSAASDPPDYGYGRYAADLDEVAERLDLRDFVLVGHSMGGMVSLVYAARYPGRMAKLVVVDSTMRMTAERIRSLHDLGAREGSRHESREAFVSRFKLRPSGTLASPDVIAHLAHRSGRQHPDGHWRHKFDRAVYGTRETIDGFDFWARIAAPALLVKGSESGRITPEIEAEVRARCPHVQVVEVPRSDHHVTLDNPSGFVDAVRPFVTDSAPRS